ncbi:MAG: caspase family protein [Candidatus Rokuibacteriota bacterium]
MGINDYHRVPRLNYAVPDALAIKELLPTLGFPARNTQVLLDREATKARIEWVLYNDFRHMASEDRLLVYFAGHGETNPLRQGEEGYILPVDADFDALPATAIAMADLRKIGQRLKGKHFLFIMDACFSGFALSRSGPEKHSGDPYLQNALREPAVQVLTAGRKGEKVVELQGHGLFTRRLLDGLRGDADVENQGFVTAAQLFSWIQPRVARESRGSMNPQFSNLDGEGQFIFFLPTQRSAHDQPGAPPRPRPPDHASKEVERKSLEEPKGALLEAERRNLEQDRRQLEEGRAQEAERRSLEQDRRRLEEERALLEERKRLDEERRGLDEQRRRLQAPSPRATPTEPAQVASIPPQAEKVPVLLSTFGHGAAGSLQGILSLGLLTAEYTIEIDGSVVVDWRTLDIESQLSLAAGPHRIRVLRRYVAARTPTLLYEGPLHVESPKSKVTIDFALGTVSVNGKTETFISQKW